MSFVGESFKLLCGAKNCDGRPERVQIFPLAWHTHQPSSSSMGARKWMRNNVNLTRAEEEEEEAKVARTRLGLEGSN